MIEQLPESLTVVSQANILSQEFNVKKDIIDRKNKL